MQQTHGFSRYQPILQQNPPQTPPSKPRFKQSFRFQNILPSRRIKYKRTEIIENLQICRLQEAGKNQTQIFAQLGIPRGQVSYSLPRGTISP